MTDKVVDIGKARLDRLPILDANIKDLRVLVERFVNQCLAMGHREVLGCFRIGRFRVRVDLKIEEHHE